MASQQAFSTAGVRAYLYADPAGHSLSPFMHAAAFARADIQGTYEAMQVAATELPGALALLRQAGVLGANLSLPHKEAAVPLLDGLSDGARRIGAVNTVIHRDGKLYGDNTDAPGLLAALVDAKVPDGPAMVLGAGGAARAAVYALSRSGRSVFIWNRSPEKASRLALDFCGEGASVTAGEFAALPWGDISLLVNATSAGLNAPGQSPLPDFPALPAHALVYDMVYKPLETRLLRDARQRGLRAQHGLGMLAHQARLSFRAWTGADVPVKVFLDAAAGALH
ncbi:shikimate dehydrogenase [Deinococcus peraridilitoris]|uniref:Shikimate dehydrogenase (NADP(+)) n=1 Tax=Deinococcus peraridilitoris (strain DSM 19664 / LMG 22246 / CIP 109416 / KR-200) TaxID=937777 RepID=K9ZXB2_DEIPD|nr:shikimate dehydrogenase [Deinococcus peraridilitoris]AFZ65839.1 shikimate 5-dehydrogenase [Deinococcus peraridilitoris DSM 19664]